MMDKFHDRRNAAKESFSHGAKGEEGHVAIDKSSLEKFLACPDKAGEILRFANELKGLGQCFVDLLRERKVEALLAKVSVSLRVEAFGQPLIGLETGVGDDDSDDTDSRS